MSVTAVQSIRSARLSTSVSSSVCAALRRGSPSSCLCLKGPKSISLINSGLTLHSSKMAGSKSFRKAFNSCGLWCTTEFSEISEARFTGSSGSCSEAVSGCNKVTISSGVDREQAYFTEAIMVARTRGEVFDMYYCRCPTTNPGVALHSFPRHSDTSDRTPSSSFSQCWNKNGRMSFTYFWMPWVCWVITSFRDISNKILC
mmetsp:Transcript_12759/g.6332  ORF Transcript_12759/g.6332 Transcript_12759/m.6332 type:complete len:201 (+) Transcript_12759:380-982(+)